MANPTVALVEKLSDGQEPSMFGRELRDVEHELKARGVDVIDMLPCNRESLLNKMDLSETFVFGGLGAMWAWAGAVGCRDMIAPSYPGALRHLLKRQVHIGSPESLMSGPANRMKRCFVKTLRPFFIDGVRMDASVATGPEVFQNLPVSSRTEEFLCSEVVGWVSEYRCYVCDGRVIGIHPYRFLHVRDVLIDCSEVEKAMPEIKPTPRFVADAIAALERSGEAVAGYALDFGLIAHGEMSLVEMNDAMSLSNYGLSASKFLDVHLARWRELTTRLDLSC